MATLASRTETLRPSGLTPLLTTTELQAYYGVSNWTVNEWVKDDCPVELTPGGARRFDIAAVRQWLASHHTAAA